MSIASVVPYHVFGFRTNVRDAVSFLDDQSLLYTCGSNIVVHSIASRSQKFIAATAKNVQISAIGLSRERHFVAVAEWGAGHAPKAVTANTQQASANLANQIIAGVVMPNAAVPSHAAAPNSTSGLIQHSSTPATAQTAPLANASTGHAPLPPASAVVIVIYGLPGFRKRKVFPVEDAAKNELPAHMLHKKEPKYALSVCFSAESKNVAVLLSDMRLSYWVWEKSRCLAATYLAIPGKQLSQLSSLGSAEPTIAAVSVNPYEDEQLCVVGQGIFRHFRVANGAFVPIELPAGINEQDVCSLGWISASRYALATLSSTIQIVEHAQVKSTIDLRQMVLFQPTMPVPADTQPSVPTPPVSASPQDDPSSAPGTERRRASRVGRPRDSQSSIASLSFPGSGTSTSATVPTLTPKLVMGSRYVLVTSGGHLHVLERSGGASAGGSLDSDAVPATPATPAILEAVTEEPATTVDETASEAVTAPPQQPSPPEQVESQQQNRQRQGSFSSDTSVLRLLRRIPLPENNAECASIAFNASEELVIITTEDCAASILPITATDLLKMTQEDTELVFVQCMPPFHRRTITGLDACIRKPYLVTCGSDHTIRVWNYLTNKCELSKAFAEEPCSVSLHPCGMYVLAGFSDKLRLLNLLSDDLRVVREFSVRGCRECAFSSGGQVFAAAQGSIILIYSTWSYDLVATLKGHNGKIKSLHWSWDDSKLVSCGIDGAVYTWNVRDQKRENEYIQKGTMYHSAICGGDSDKTMYLVGSDKLLKEVTESLVTREVHTATDLTQVAMSRSGRMMFLGTGTGSVRSVRFPLPYDLNNLDSDELAQDHSAHGEPVTRLRVSVDDHFLFSAADDGTLYIYRISDKDTTKTTAQWQAEVSFAEELLMTKSDLEEKKSTITELKTRLDELKIEHDYQLRLKDMFLQDKLKELTTEMTKVIENLKISSAVLRSERDKDEARYKDEYQLLVSKNKKLLRSAENKYNHVLMTEYEKFQAAQEDQRRKQTEWQARFREFDEQKEREIGQLGIQYDGKLKFKNDEIIKLKDDIQAQLREFTEHHKQLSEDLDTEVVNITQRYEKQLKAEKEICSRMNGENGIMKKKFLTLNKEIEDSKAEVSRLRENEARLKKIMRTLETDLASEKQKMAGKDKDIQEQERRVYELKKKNQELEKFKFVLDFKIKDLKKQIEPREQRIAEMTAQIRDINDQMERMHLEEKRLNELSSTLNGSLDVAKSDFAKQHSKKRALEHLFRQVQTDVTHAVAYIQDPPLLKKSVLNMSKKYCSGLSFNTKQDMDPEVVEESTRQEAFLRQSVTTLKDETKKQMSIYRIDNLNMIQTNQALIREIEELRKIKKIKIDKPLELPKIAGGRVTTASITQAATVQSSQTQDSLPQVLMSTQ
ncbi:Cilia- and flagella-associated protein 57 [Sorochytrium milnesiophthora]